MSTRDWAAFLLPTAALVSPAFAVDYLSVAQAQTLLFPGAKSFAEQPLKLNDEQRDASRPRAACASAGTSRRSGVPKPTASCRAGSSSTR